MNKYFSIDETIFDIVNKQPKVLTFLIEIGFKQLKNEDVFNQISQHMTLKEALELKDIDLVNFEKEIIEILDNEPTNSIHLEGVLPCPIRIPILEKLEKWKKENEISGDSNLTYNLQSANLGLGSIAKKLNSDNVHDIPELIMSVGFDILFNKKIMKPLIDKNIFAKDRIEMNDTFANRNIDLRDPNGIYTITGVVPAIFVVDLNELNGRNIPKTWDDLLSEEFENSVSIPMSDLDLFNALILNIYHQYGEVGIKKLARSYFKNLHPSQMVTPDKKETNHAVSVIPYFFTQMIQANSLKVIWPEDGAIISPIFIIRKNTKNKAGIKAMNFFLSEEVGEILSLNGKFPSTHRNIDNQLDIEKKFKWVGWDFINNNDIGELLQHLEQLFEQAIQKKG